MKLSMQIKEKNILKLDQLNQTSTQQNMSIKPKTGKIQREFEKSSLR